MSVQRIAQRVDDTAQHSFADIDGSNTAGTLNDHALLDLVGQDQQYGTHVVLFKVHHYSHNSVIEFQQFVGFGIEQPVNTCHTIAHLQDGTYLLQLQRNVNATQLLQQDIRYFTRFYCY